MPFQVAWDRLRRDRAAVASLVVLLAVAVFALLAPLWAHLTGHPYDRTFPATGLDVAGQPRGPGAGFPLGADRLGRDVLVRAAYGTRISLVVGVCAALLATVAGTVAGIVSGFAGGAVDTLLARLMDMTLALPYLLVAITLATTFQVSSPAAGLALTTVVIAFFSAAASGRVIRGQVLALRRSEFIDAARSIGASDARIMVEEVLPNLAAQVTVLTSLQIPAAIVFEATLSFLGAGVPPPTPSLGSMLGEGGEMFRSAWWLLAVPGALLLAITLAFNLLGDGIRDALDPRDGAGRRR
ncbi:peptide/nickel transport system permease protein [Actinomadura pelletieri DSM 43383]|uniref:Peptide/nickel transport system permease protein n=1 Tax=Actinomadura pelletieri DSM 43383 TaxID=1120940 RepID=A0A495QLG6_9ACTN|nr:ABC transporter permease [Actinomadura pelletieri]RKS73373.1 peptide/nickel transport system permease protein [Actinomadura pelletieri DSM 43383]